MDGEDNITITYARGPFCKTKSEIVKLICICRSPWIEGSTSRAIYGDKQNDFASHVCCKCKNWFYHFCLRKCDVKVPKRTHDFQCPTCQIPLTISWAHSNYTNTCTSDNILIILLLHCHEIPTFIECIGNSPAEKALKVALCTMLDGDVHNGKTIMLDHIKSVLPLKTCEKKINCFGSEYSNFPADIRMWKSWSVHPHLNAEPAQGQGYDTRLQVTHTAL